MFIWDFLGHFSKIPFPYNYMLISRPSIYISPEIEGFSFLQAVSPFTLRSLCLKNLLVYILDCSWLTMWWFQVQGRLSRTFPCVGSPQTALCGLFEQAPSDWCEVLPQCGSHFHFSLNKWCGTSFQGFQISKTTLWVIYIGFLKVCCVLIKKKKFYPRTLF